MDPVFIVRSLDEWPGERTAEPKRSKFKAEYSKTLALLERELWHLEADRVVLLCDCDVSHIRQDGQLRAEARLRTQGVVLCFDSKFGPLKYPCDAFDHWQDNLRGIALAMEHQRAMDRYGVTRRGEQYRGWAALPAPGGNGRFSRDQAAAFVAGPYAEPEAVLTDPAVRRECYRKRAFDLHPDRNLGQDAPFKKLGEAMEVLAETT